MIVQWQVYTNRPAKKWQPPPKRPVLNDVLQSKSDQVHPSCPSNVCPEYRAKIEVLFSKWAEFDVWRFTFKGPPPSELKSHLIMHTPGSFTEWFVAFFQKLAKMAEHPKRTQCSMFKATSSGRVLQVSTFWTFRFFQASFYEFSFFDSRWKTSVVFSHVSRAENADTILVLPVSCCSFLFGHQDVKKVVSDIWC